MTDQPTTPPPTGPKGAQGPPLPVFTSYDDARAFTDAALRAGAAALGLPSTRRSRFRLALTGAWFVMATVAAIVGLALSIGEPDGDVGRDLFVVASLAYAAGTLAHMDSRVTRALARPRVVKITTPGPVGPQGITGPQGPQGARGAPAPAPAGVPDVTRFSPEEWRALTRVGINRAAQLVEAELAREVKRLSTDAEPDPFAVPMLRNWLGGLKAAAALLRGDSMADRPTP